MRSYAAWALINILFICPTPSTADSASVVTTVERLPVAGSELLCGIEFTFSGELLMINHVTLNTSGVLNVASHLSYQGVTAIAPDGAVFHLVGVKDSSHTIDTNGGAAFAWSATAMLVGQGSDETRRLQFLFHRTANADGTVTSEVNRFRVDDACVVQ
jgi:hypothetical protein